MGSYPVGQLFVQPPQRACNAESYSISWPFNEWHISLNRVYLINFCTQDHPRHGFNRWDKTLQCHIASFAESMHRMIPIPIVDFLPLSHRAGGVLSSRAWVGGRSGGCPTCGTHVSVTAWRIFPIRNSVELHWPVVVQCHGHLPIWPTWACPWAINLSNLAQIGSRLCGT